MIRALGQKEYEKRKQAALEVENQVRELHDAGDTEKIRSFVETLVGLAESPQPNARKGALHALAGTAIGLREEVATMLPTLLPPVLAAFGDHDARVRYYACESLYNIAKVARGRCVAHLNEIFDGLFKLSADTDIQVQNGMQLLDRLMKDVVTESERFDATGFLPLIGERIFVSNPFSRQFLVGWLSALDSVPDIDLLQHLPVFFDGLFNMLADANKEIRQQTYNQLSELLREVRMAESVAYAPLVETLVQHCSSQDKLTRVTAISWLHQLMLHGGNELLPFSAQILSAVLASIAHHEEEIRQAASRANGTLRSLLEASDEANLEMPPLLQALRGHLSSTQVRTLLAALEWLHMLLEKSAGRVMALSQQLWPALFKCLANPSEEVVRLDIEALARMAPDEANFVPFCEYLLGMLRVERQLLEQRGKLIVQQLCELIAPRRVFVTIARALTAEEDLGFAAEMVQTLNLIVMTSPEAIELRLLLQQSVTDAEGASLFQTLYPAWAHNPVALLSICLIAQAYEHAAALVMHFGKVEISLRFLLQIDKLVQLFESPIFTHVRLHLLEPEQHPNLLKAMWGILMLLPQSPAFQTLQARISSIPELGLFRLQLEERLERRKAPAALQPPSIDFRALLRTYLGVQHKHQRRIFEQSAGKRLVHEPGS